MVVIAFDLSLQVHRALHDTLTNILRQPEPTVDDNGDTKTATREPTIINLCDFDSVEYNLTIQQDDLNTLLFNVKLPVYKQIKQHGAEDILKQNYAQYINDTITTGYDITLRLPLSNDVVYNQQQINSLSSIKTTVVSGVYIKYFTPLLTNQPPPSESIVYSEQSDTLIYIIPGKDRVTVVYEIDFNDKVDKAIARIFMQEFVDSKRRLGGGMYNIMLLQYCIDYISHTIQLVAIQYCIA